MHNKNASPMDKAIQLELAYVEKLRLRKLEIEKATSADGSTSSNAKPEVADSPPDEVLQGKLAEVVWDQAKLQLKSDLPSLLEFWHYSAEKSQDNSTLESLTTVIYDYLRLHYRRRVEFLEARVNAAVRAALAADASVQRGLQMLVEPTVRVRDTRQRAADAAAFRVFDEALEGELAECEDAWRACLRFCQRALEENQTDKLCTERKQKAATVLSRLKDKGFLLADDYVLWAKLLHHSKIDSNEDAAEELLAEGINKHPKSVDLWMQYLQYVIQKNEKPRKIQKLFNQATKLIPEQQSLPIWKLAVQWALATKPHTVEVILERAVESLPTEVANPLKELYLDYLLLTNEGDSDDFRCKCRHLCRLQPNSIEFYQKLLDIERAALEPRHAEVRAIFELALTEHGSHSAELWRAFLEFETQYAPERVADVHSRAVRSLCAEKAQKFVEDIALANVGSRTKSL